MSSNVVIAETQYAETMGRKPSMLEIATAINGRDITRGYVADNLIMPIEAPGLSGYYAGDYKLYKDIARDDQVKTCRNQRELSLIAKEWYVEPGDNSRQAKKAADRLVAILKRLEWDDKTRMMLSAILYGYSVAEVIWATDGMEITIGDIKVRNRLRFGFLSSGELRMRTANNAMSGEALPPAKFWTFSCGSDHDDAPYGLGLAHHLYWPVLPIRKKIDYYRH